MGIVQLLYNIRTPTHINFPSHTSRVIREIILETKNTT